MVNEKWEGEWMDGSAWNLKVYDKNGKFIKEFKDGEETRKNKKISRNMNNILREILTRVSEMRLLKQY